MFHVHFKRMCILFLEGLLCVCLLSPYLNLLSSIYIWSDVLFKTIVSLLILCLDDLSMLSVMLKYPAIIAFFSISPFMYVNICFMYLGSPMFGAQIVIIVNTFIGLIPLSLWCPSLSLATVFVLKSILSNKSIAILPFSFPCFHLHRTSLSPPTLWSEVCVSYRYHIDGSFLKIHSVTLHLLSEAFSPFTFKVINRYILISILLIVFWLFQISSLFLSFSSALLRFDGFLQRSAQILCSLFFLCVSIKGF